MENFKTPEQIVQEIVGDDAVEHIDFKAQADEIIERLKLELASKYVRAVHTLQFAEQQSWKGRYAKKIDEVVEMCLEQCGLDPRNIPEYYSEIKESIKPNQEIIDFFYPEKNFDLQQEIENGKFKFPSLKDKEELTSRGYSLPLFIPRVGRRDFMSILDKAYMKALGDSLLSREAISAFHDKKQFYPDSLIFVKPNLEMDEDEEMKKTFENSSGVMRNKFGRLFGTHLKIEGLGLEEYMFFQTHNYLRYGRFADRKYWMSLAGEGEFRHNLGDRTKTICLQADDIGFQFSKLHDDQNVGTRILFRAE